MDHTAVLLESQPDWLTASAHTAPRTADLKAVIHPLLTAEIARGERVRPYRLMGYVGYQAGRVRWGEREAAGLVQLSGDLAARHLDRVLPVADGVTRLDLACTVQLPEYRGDVARIAYAEATAYRAANPRAALGHLHEDNAGGATLYVGDRVSDYMLRLYNKQAERESESDHGGAERYARCWRYELEIKGGPAMPVARAVAAHADPAGYVQSFLHDYVAHHGISPLFPPSGAQALRPGLSRRSDRERTLRWFRTSVAPSIRLLIETGGTTEVYEALGLGPPSGGGDTVTKL